MLSTKSLFLAPGVIKLIPDVDCGLADGEQPQQTSSTRACCLKTLPALIITPTKLSFSDQAGPFTTATSVELQTLELSLQNINLRARNAHSFRFYALSW